MGSEISCLVFGAGAIGTYIGGSLTLHGQHVAFLEQPSAAEELRQRGLRLSLEGQQHHITNPLVFSSLAEALAYQPYDLGVFALKSFDTQTALQAIPPAMQSSRRIPPFLCLQNGVENEGVLAALLDQEHVIAGTVTSSIGRRAIGDIQLERKRGLGVAAGHSLSGRIVQVFDEAGLNAHLFPCAADMKWSKMLTNLVGNATSAILDIPPAMVFDHPGLFSLEISQLRETLAVMAGHGIRVVDLPGTPVRLLAAAARWLPRGFARPLLSRAISRGRGGKMPSFHIDLYSGRGQSEVEYLNGAVVRFGASKGIPTPVNEFLTRTLLALTRGELPLDRYRQNPGKLLEDYRS